MGSTPVRIDDKLYGSARVVGQASSRSAAQQVDYWVRLGRAVSMVETDARRRIEDAVAGRTPLSTLTVDERATANAEIDAVIEQRAGSVSYADILAAEGISTVSMDADGSLVRRDPDGTRVIIG